MAAVGSRPRLEQSGDDEAFELFKNEVLLHGNVTESQLNAAYRELSSQPGGIEAIVETKVPTKVWRFEWDDTLEGKAKISSVNAKINVRDQTAALSLDGEWKGYFRPNDTQINGSFYYDELNDIKNGTFPAYVYSENRTGKGAVLLYKKKFSRPMEGVPFARFNFEASAYISKGSWGSVKISRP